MWLQCELFLFVVMLFSVMLPSLARNPLAKRNNSAAADHDSGHRLNIEHGNIHSNETGFIWEGGTFPYHDPRDHNGIDFYEKAIIIAPIIGAISLILLLATGAYILRHHSPNNRKEFYTDFTSVRSNNNRFEIILKPSSKDRIKRFLTNVFLPYKLKNAFRSTNIAESIVFERV